MLLAKINKRACPLAIPQTSMGCQCHFTGESCKLGSSPPNRGDGDGDGDDDRDGDGDSDGDEGWGMGDGGLGKNKSAREGPCVVFYSAHFAPKPKQKCYFDTRRL